MAGLKMHNPQFAMSAGRITADELDSRLQYSVVHPGTSDTALGTVAPGTVAGNFVLDNVTLDYPRNVLFSVIGPANGVGGTAKVYGYNQFGVSCNETITIASANAGGSAAGTLIFSTLSSASYVPNGGDYQGTPKLGYAIGTATGLIHMFGLPWRLGGTADVKSISWIKNGTSTALTGGTIGAYVDATQHGFRGTAILALTDSFVVSAKPTKDCTTFANVA